MAGYLLYGGRFTQSALVEMVMAEGDITYALRATFAEVRAWSRDYAAPQARGAGVA